MRQCIIAAINLYQHTLSPDHGVTRVFFPLGACRFYPTCSEYTKQSIKRYGVAKGLAMGGAQLARCHPFNNLKCKNQNVKLLCLSLRSRRL